jgi:DNA topoisomerase-2
MSNSKVVCLTDRDHVLKRPAMYIGAVNSVTSNEYIFENNKIEYKEVNFVPGLIKIINEIIDNSVDASVKSGFAKGTHISVKMTEDSVTVKDDGTGIPYDVINGKTSAEIAWGTMRSGSNFEDDEHRIQIGMNGVGSFCTNCFSKKFIGISDDGTHKVTCEFTNNASNCKTVEGPSKSTGVSVTFYPDLERFGLEKIDESHILMIKQRLINLNLTYPQITFKFNGKTININSFKKYVSLFGENPEVFETEKYSFAILHNPNDDFKQFSYVDGLKINDGGTHIDLFSMNIVNRIRDKLAKKYKSIKPGDIKNKLFVIAFLKEFPNPKFNSQSKEKITNSNAEMSDYFGEIDYDTISKRVLKNSTIIDPITEVYKIKEELKRRQEMKSLNTPKKIKNDKYLPAIGNSKYLLIVEGECLEQSTEVLMSDFTTKKIRNLHVNETLLSENYIPVTVTSISTSLKKVIKFKTPLGDILCGENHRLKVYDTRDHQFKILTAKEIKAGYAYYRFLKSKLNKDTQAIKIKIAGKNWQGKYFALTDDDQYLSFTENDVFQVVRNGSVIRIPSSDIQSNDLILMNKVVDN